MKVYRIYDVNGEPTGLETIDADEAEMFADRGSCGDHVVEIDTVKEAAEDLLEALRHAVTQLDDRNWPDKELHEPWEETQVRARAAIDKAEGSR